MDAGLVGLFGTFGRASHIVNNNNTNIKCVNIRLDGRGIHLIAPDGVLLYDILCTYER